VNILGVSAYYHDSAAVLLSDGSLVAAAQEERFTRRRHDSGFPAHALRYCLEQCGGLSRIDAVVFYEKPLRKFDRLLRMHLAAAPGGFESFAVSMPRWVRGKLLQRQEILERVASVGGEEAWNGELLFAEHHQSHAASAFFPSPFERAAIVTMDGVGEWTTTSIAVGDGNSIRPQAEIRFPHSLGLLYSAFTAYLGFRVNSGEHKMMGLAPYGEPRFKDLILRELVDLKRDGSFRLDMRYFGYTTGLTMTTPAFHELFGRAPREPESDLDQFAMDVAASIQAAVEEIVLRIARHVAQSHGEPNLCLAGGVALNCVANRRIVEEGLFERVWVQPAAGDAGGALGAALAAHHMHFGGERKAQQPDGMRGSYLGPSFSTDEAQEAFARLGGHFEVRSDHDLLDEVADQLDAGMAIGWFQGRMEYGPRALGARSIIADARRADMQRNLNLRIKFRESFRPFAPAVLAEQAAAWFELDGDSPYMLFTAPVRHDRRLEVTDDGAHGLEKLNLARSTVPAVTHVDWSARLQTVHRETNPRFHGLLERFYRKTGCPVVINTSFNIRGEPIVCTPEDAFRCFMGTGLDMLVVENCVLYKDAQDEHLAAPHRELVQLD
jgi:carbamoyltransferase